MNAGGVGPGGATPGGISVRDVVRAVVAEFAPEELPVVDGLAGFDDAAAVRRLRRKSRDEPLGFGLAEITVMVTPAVWLAVDQAARSAGGAIGKPVGDTAIALIRKLTGRKSPPATVPPLSPAQLQEVRHAVQKGAVQRGLSGKRGEVIADAVVAMLATGSLDQRENTAHGDGEPGTGGGTLSRE